MEFYYNYPPAPPYAVTYLHNSFPEHHHLFEHTRQRIGAAYGHSHQNDIYNPHIDVRETEEKYYIDIELPGLQSKEALSLTWINGRTLLMPATISRPQIEEGTGNTVAEAVST